MKPRHHKGFMIRGKREGLVGFVAHVYGSDDGPLDNTPMVEVRNPRSYDRRFRSGLDAITRAKSMIDDGRIVHHEGGAALHADLDTAGGTNGNQ